MKPSIIVVMEDDPYQSEHMVRDLKSSFPEMKIIECATERELRQCVDGLSPGQLACAVLDAMVPWDFPSENMPVPPEDVQTGDLFGAGKRCLDYVRSKLGKETPVCIHTLLDREDVQIGPDDQFTTLVTKQPNGELVGVVAKLVGQV